MTTTEISQKLKSIISSFSGLAESDIKVDVPLMDQGLDSLSAAELLFELEDVFGFDINKETDIDTNKFLPTATLNDFVKLIEKQAQ